MDELSITSSEFAAMWRKNDVRSYGEGASGSVIFNPGTRGDAKRIRSVILDSARRQSKPRQMKPAQ